MTAEEILAGAAARVERGWCQHTFTNGDKVCLVGAIAEVAGVYGRQLYKERMQRPLSARHPAQVALQAVREELETPGEFGPALWNNAPGRTVEEVATVLRNSKRFLP